MNQAKVAVASRSYLQTSYKKMIAFSAICLLLSILTLSWAQSTTYHLIAGSFKTLKSANELVDALTIKGFSPMIIFPTEKSSHYRVSVYNAQDQGLVQSFKKQMPGSVKYWTLAVQGAGLRSPSNTPPNNSRVTATGSSLYHVVIGSFPTRDAALRSQGARQSQGFDAYVLEPTAGTKNYRIAVYRSSNKKEVDAYRQQLIRSGKVPSAWIQETGGSTGTEVSTGTGNRVVGGVYHLIGGSFQQFEDAETYKQNMLGEGYNALIIFPKPGVSTTYRVSIARSAIKNNVQQVQARYKAAKKKDSWIWLER